MGTRSVRALVAAIPILVVLSPFVSAQALITTHRLPLSLAAVGIEADREACAAKGFQVSVAVVAREGDMQALSRADGAGIQTVQSATDKAITSAVFGVDSGFWVGRAERGEPISPLSNQLPNLLLARGGVAIEVEDEIVGGLAVAGAPGGEIDEECAVAGREAILSAVRRTFNGPSDATP